MIMLYYFIQGGILFMKNLKILLSYFLMMAVFITFVLTAEQVYAKTKVYETYGCYVKTFKKSKGKLIIETVENSKHGDPQKPIKLKLKPAKKIKYTLYNAGETKPSGKTNFKELQKNFKDAYDEYQTDGDYTSPPEVSIYVKNKQITEIRITFS